jgi:hypothetical protein
VTRRISLRMPARAHAANRTSRAQRLVQAVGADPAFVEAVLGDLAEEYALRVACDGYVVALWWYVREAFRSTPHLIASWFSYARRYQRSRFLACMAGVALTSLVVLIAVFTRNGSPWSLTTGATDVVVINNELPVRLPVRVLDAKGHVLNSAGVRYRWVSGAPVSLSTAGEVTCREAGDSYIHVSFEALSRDLQLRCRPIHDLWLGWDEFVAGDSAHTLSLLAVDPDGRSVNLIAGSIAVRDSDIATLDGMQLRPKSPGVTVITAVAGDHLVRDRIRVLQPVNTLTALRQGQAFVISSLRLDSGDTRKWRISPGFYSISLRPDRTNAAGNVRDPHAVLALATSNSNCVALVSDMEQRDLCVALQDASVIVYAPRGEGRAGSYRGRLFVRLVPD